MDPTPNQPEQAEPLIEEAIVQWCNALQRVAKRGTFAGMPVVEGTLTRMVGLTLEAVGCQAPIGARCDVVTENGDRVETEVVGFSGEILYLMPISEVRGLVPNARVIPTRNSSDVSVGPELLGRVIDGQGDPLDNKGPIYSMYKTPLEGQKINPLNRSPIRDVLDVGVRAINALSTIGRGQRMGLFAGSGVGKSILLGMMTKYTEADVVVVGLIGERGREVKEFVEEILGDEGLKKSVVVAAPADASPLMRVHGAMQATSIAEYFRDQGKHVLLLMDSLTRFAQAQREISLSIGEPPATKGYPPSVFAKLPQLVERAGNGASDAGSITAFYTVLVEGDDHNEPIADAARAILDGHIVLSRELAESGQYPAIDVEASISRLAPHIVSPQHLRLMQTFKSTYSRYQQNRDLINVGAYQPGTDASIDYAVNMQPEFKAFLSQDMKQPVAFSESYSQLEIVLRPSDPISTELSSPQPVQPPLESVGYEAN